MLRENLQFRGGPGVGVGRGAGLALDCVLQGQLTEYQGLKIF